MAHIRTWGWIPVVIPALCLLLLPQRSEAIPAFARKYGVKCFTCHTIPPALNKTGYMFKRLGYRMPPDNMEPGKAAPSVKELDKDIKWSLTNSLALVTQGSFTVQKTKQDDASTSKSSFNLDKALLFTGGSLPDTNFSYFAEYKLYEDGETALEQAMANYTGGKANSSWFGKAGMMHVQEGEGTRAAMMFNLFPDPAPTLTNVSPINFTLDQHPVGVNVGYTWASPYFKQIFGVSAKVTNGVNADGSEILFDSTKNAKDFWFDADYWFGPDGGVTFLSYYGRKDQVQNAGATDEFTFRPTIRRYGVFGNYLFFDKLDVLGGYLRANDDWKFEAAESTGHFISNDYRAEVDYYVQRGFALSARIDRLNQRVEQTDSAHFQDWAVAAQKTLTSLGNVIVRGSYGYSHDTDPVTYSVTRDKLFRLDVRLMW